MSDNFLPVTQASAAAEIRGAADAFRKALSNFDGAADENRSGLIQLLNELVDCLEVPAEGESAEIWSADLATNLSEEKPQIDFFFSFMERTAGQWELTEAGQKVAEIRQQIESL